LFLFGTPATATALRFLLELCVGSPPPVREPTSFQQRRQQDGYQQTTREPAAMRPHQSDDLAECQREGKDQSGEWRNGTSFGLNDLEALVTLACDAKEWIAAHVFKR
jgi:hypothetical protein